MRVWHNDEENGDSRCCCCKLQLPCVHMYISRSIYRYVRESFEREQMIQLSDEERRGILDGLKNNWDELHHGYQGLSVVTDTPAKKARKERMEANMKQLEKDIEQIEKHPIIYVDNTA